MATFQKPPEQPSASQEVLAHLGLGDLPGAAILGAFWPILLGVILFIILKLAGKRFWGSVCLGTLSIVQLVLVFAGGAE